MLHKKACIHIFSCDQAALRMVFSACPSVCSSVRLSHLFHYLPIIVSPWNFQFSGIITNDQSKVNAKDQGQRSKVKVTEVKTQLCRFRTVTPVWIHIWWWNDAHSLMVLIRGALLFSGSSVKFMVTQLQNRRFWPSLNSPMAMKARTKLEATYKRCPIVFQDHTSNCKVKWLTKSSILTQNRRFRTVTPVWNHQWLQNYAQSLK